MEAVAIGPDDVLVIVDVQNDFCTGSLAIPDAEAIVPLLNRLSAGFSQIVATQDWHPPRHISFATSHPGEARGAIVPVAYGKQKLFADHCVQGSWGAEFHGGLDTTRADLILRKGVRREVDSFSAFVENDGTTTTGLAGYLQARGIGRVFVAGLALYGCVRFSAVGARKAGFPTFLITDASRSPVNPQAESEGLAEMAEAGVQLIRSEQIRLAA